MEEYQLTIIDIQTAKNWDKSKQGTWKPHPRPYPTDTRNRITNKPIPIERARVLYKVTKADIPVEELKAMNRKYMEKLRNQKNGT